MEKRSIRILSIALFVALLLWGGYALVSYLGIPVHQKILLPAGGPEVVDRVCEGRMFCRGLYGFFPAVSHTFARAKPFLWYAVIPLVLFVSFLGWRWFQTGEESARITLTPLRIFLTFLTSLWLLFTVLGFQSNDGHPFRYFFEPLPQVYVNAGPETLDTLQGNYHDLLDRGCLAQIGTTNHGARVYQLAITCMQLSFLTRVLPQVFVILALAFEFLILGRVLLTLLRFSVPRLLLESVVSCGLGACGFIVLLWVLAKLHLFTPMAGWLLVILVPLLGFTHARYWIERFLFSSWQVRCSWSSVSCLTAWLLLSYVVLNFLVVVRPFPIGWDDLGSYVNRPRLMVSYGHSIPGMGTFQWEYLTSLGFLLFGYDSLFGATAALMINWFEGLLALLIVFAFANIFLGQGAGALSALLYYSLPLVGHFSFADMKVDNAVFAMGALSMLALFLFFREEADPVSGGVQGAEKVVTSSAEVTVDTNGRRFSWVEVRREALHVLLRREWQWLVLAGVFGAFAFSMKITSTMVLVASASVLTGAWLGVGGFAGSFFLLVSYYLWRGPFNMSDISDRIFGDPTLLNRNVLALIVLLIGAAVLLPTLLRKQAKSAKFFSSVFVYAGSFFLAVSPWLYANHIQHGHLRHGHILPHLLLAPPNTLTPILLSTKGAEADAYGQDIRRLEDDLAVDPAHPACQSTAKTEELDRYWGFRKGWGHYLTLPWRTVMNIDSAGYYVMTMPAVLLFPLLLLLPFFWAKRGWWVRWLLWGTAFIIFQWMFLANGILWYGVGMFLGLALLLEVLVRHAPDLPNRVLAGFLVAMSLLIVFALRFWQYEQQRNLLEYPLGKVSAEAIQERTIPYYDDIREFLARLHEERPDRPYAYRVGTFIPYFIPRNLEIFPLADNQLDFFKCLYQEHDGALTLKRLQALGFSSIIFDTNTATIERDSNGTLHQKVNAFLEFVNNQRLGMDVRISDTDRGVAFIVLP